MAEAGGERAQLLRAQYHGQTARIHWHELQAAFARGSVIGVAAGLDLVEVAVQLGLDNAAQFEQWMSAGSVAPVSDDQALAWYDANQELWAVVAPPWVLVQQTWA
jgi:hypothetical protein